MKMKIYQLFLTLLFAFSLGSCNEEDDIMEIFANGQTWHWSGSYDTPNWKDNNKSTMLLLTKKNEECEQLKKLADANPNSTLRLRNEIRDLQAVSVKCKEALEEIKKICLQDRNIQDICLISTQLTKTRIKSDIQDKILTIIDKAKGWK